MNPAQLLKIDRKKNKYINIKMYCMNKFIHK